jgi:hypothetical protein
MEYRTGSTGTMTENHCATIVLPVVVLYSSVLGTELTVLPLAPIFLPRRRACVCV